MWKRKEIKLKARKVIKRNYWTIILVCAILAIVTGEFGMSSVGIERNDEPIDYGFLYKLEETKKNKDNYHKQQFMGESTERIDDAIEKIIISSLNSALKSQKYIFKTVDAVQSFYSNANEIGIALFIGAILAFLFIVFIADPLIVGGRRFFIKTRNNKKAEMNVLISVFKKGEWMNIAKTMLLRNIFTALWYLTIIGGIIKTYQYKMVPYILAEEPKTECMEVLRLSKQMMKGNKWKAFVLDLSFLPWDILSFLTFGLLSIFYVNPYVVATGTELYVELKQNKEENNK